jgi:hypothetical protein
MVEKETQKATVINGPRNPQRYTDLHWPCHFDSSEKNQSGISADHLTDIPNDFLLFLRQKIEIDSVTEFFYNW